MIVWQGKAEQSSEPGGCELAALLRYRVLWMCSSVPQKTSVSLAVGKLDAVVGW